MIGTFFAVVGPSGAGKDSLIAGARERLEPTGMFSFPARHITRPADAGGEDHVPVTAGEFAAIHSSGGFCLSWRAHGHAYGISAEIDRDLAVGRNVVANISRAAVGQARKRFDSVRVVVVTAPPEVLAARLATRGREDGSRVAERLRRASLANPEGGDVDIVANAGDLADAVHAFVALLRAHGSRAGEA